MPHENTRISPQSRIAEVALVLLIFSSAAFAQDQPAPVETEKAVSGTVEAGYRWRWLSGNEDMYRSTINLGRGPKLNSFLVNYKPQANAGVRFLDRLTVQGMSWGGEPYSTFNLSAGHSDRYEFRMNYRHFDYFNAVPSFANPTPARTGLTQSTQDISRRLTDAQLTIRPFARISPYVAYDFDSGKGPGTTNFVQDANEYTVATNIDNATHTYRGGVSLKFTDWSGGVEVGGSGFHDNQHVAVAGANLGNRATLFLGQRLELDSLQQNYDVDGHDRFLRAYGETHWLRKLTFSGQFSYSRPTTSTHYSDSGAGRFVLQETLQSFTNERTITQSDARYPHPSGSLGAEYRPTDRVRIVETLSTDRYRITGSADTNQTFVPAATVSESDSSVLKASFIRQRLDAIVDLNRFASVHAGHEYVDASATSPGSLLESSGTRDVIRNRFTAGVAFRFQSRFRGNVDYQEERGDAVFFRTDIRRARRVWVRGRYDVNRSLQVGISASIWNNENTASDVLFFEKSRETSADVTWTPDSGKRFTVFASYTRGTFRSDLPFIVPQNFQTDRSLYRDRGHSGSMSLTAKILPRLEAQAGGSFYISTSPQDDGSQTRPTRFYNPTGRLTYKATDVISFFTEWDWHAYSNRAFRQEDYRANLLMTGLGYRF